MSGLFHAVLVEEFKKRSMDDVDVVASKRKNFNAMLSEANSALKEKSYSKARSCYYNIIEYLNKEPYIDELALLENTEYYIKCCYCYSVCMKNLEGNTNVVEVNLETYILDLRKEYPNNLLPVYLQLLLDIQRENWLSVLCLCDQEFDNRNEDITVNSFNELLPSKVEILDKIDVFKDRALFSYVESMSKLKSKSSTYRFWTKNLNSRIMDKLQNLPEVVKEIDLHKIFHNDVLPVWCQNNQKSCIFYYDAKFLSQCRQCMLGKLQDATKEFAVVCDVMPKANFGSCNIKNKSVILKLEMIHRKINELPAVRSEEVLMEKVGDIEKLFSKVRMKKDVNGKEILNSVQKTSETQTEKNKTSHKYIQTEKVKHTGKTGETQTEKNKTTNKHLQTEGVKHNNAEVQVNLESELLTAVLDIKNRLLIAQDKRDDSIVKLTKKICQCNEKLNEDQKKKQAIEQEFHMKTMKYEMEIKQLKEQLNECRNNKKQLNERNILLQQLLMDQIKNNFDIQQFIYKRSERHAQFMISYLNDIVHFLTPSSIPNDSTVKNNISIWEAHFKTFEEKLSLLKNIYKKNMADIIFPNNFELISWPELPDCPKEEDNIIFLSFKPAIKNILEIESKLRNFVSIFQGQSFQIPSNIYSSIPFQYSPYALPSRPFWPNLSSPISSPYKQGQSSSTPFENFVHQQNSQEQKPVLHHLRSSVSTECLNKNTEKKEWKLNHGNVKKQKSNPTGAASTSSDSTKKSEKNCNQKELAGSFAQKVSASGVSESINKEYQEEKKLLQYIFENCHGATEEQVSLAMIHAVTINQGTLKKVPKEKILEIVKTFIRDEAPKVPYVRSKKLSAWMAPKSPHSNWDNDNPEYDCAICIEGLFTMEIYTLKCKHQFHKECIRKWLKTNSVCPICRVHTVMDKDFPPLH